MTRGARIKACVAALTVVLSMPGAARAQQLSAVDAFHLRGECHQLGQKLIAAMDNLESMIIDKTWDRYTDTNYNAADNRCYILIQESPSVHGEKRGENCRRAFLRDGQTGDMLAWTEDGPTCEYRNGVFKASHHGVVIEKPGTEGFDATHDFITEKMSH